MAEAGKISMPTPSSTPSISASFSDMQTSPERTARLTWSTAT
jgi:hypothetical protein